MDVERERRRRDALHVYIIWKGVTFRCFTATLKIPHKYAHTQETWYRFHQQKESRLLIWDIEVLNIISLFCIKSDFSIVTMDRSITIIHLDLLGHWLMIIFTVLSDIYLLIHILTSTVDSLKLFREKRGVIAFWVWYRCDYVSLSKIWKF